MAEGQISAGVEYR